MNKTTKIYKAILPIYQQILDGTILAIDPSTGSKSSKPGFAYYEKGKLTESGEIDLDISASRNARLYEISRTIREDFEKPDILIVEYIPPVTYFKSSVRMNKTSLMALQKAIGAVLASQLYNHVLEIPAASWKTWKPPEYEKTDEWDAICLGLCAIGIAGKIKEDKEK